MDKSPHFLQNALNKSKLCIKQNEHGDTHGNRTATSSRSRDASHRPLKFLKGNSTGLNLCTSTTDENQQCEPSEQEPAGNDAVGPNGDVPNRSEAPSYLRNAGLARRPLRTDTEKVKKPVTVCSNCGGFTTDFASCDFCHKQIPFDAKPYNIKSGPWLVRKSEAFEKIKFYGRNADRRSHSSTVIRKACKSHADTAKKPLRFARRRNVSEPVCLTISSDEEDENTLKSEEACNDMNTINTSNSSERNKVEAESHIVDLRKKPRMENGNAYNCLPSPEALKSDDNQLFQDERCQLSIYLKCRSIRVGSYKFVSKNPVKISQDGITFSTLPVSGVKEDVHLSIRPPDMVRILANFSSCLPALFLFTSPGCASLIRDRLRMSGKGGPCYDPGSDDEARKRITFIPLSIGVDERQAITQILYAYKDGNLLSEIDTKMVNEILLRSTPIKVGDVVRSLNRPSPNRDRGRETRSATQREVAAPTPSQPAEKIMTYPPPPQTGGITITTDDFMCLDEGNFLNDVIIDFYLRYLVQNILSEENRRRTHIFSSFFYRRLMQSPLSRHLTPESSKMSPAENRHARVKTWTRHVDIFDKDFIIIPINESSHWFLAVVCFPYLDGPVLFSHNSNVSTPELSSTPPLEPDTNSMDVDENNDSQVSSSNEVPDMLDSVETGLPLDDTDPSFAEAEKDEDADNSSLMVPENATSVITKSPLKGPIKQPCILIFDSLSGGLGRTRVIKSLREYLQVEWKVKKKTSRLFDKNQMKGGFPEVPQQTNYSDCGIYVLQYVESFFENPIQNYRIPIKELKDWFSDEHVGQKRVKLKRLICELGKEQKGKNAPANETSSRSADDEQQPSAADAPPPLDTTNTVAAAES